MSEPTLLQSLEYFGNTLNWPEGGQRGYRSLLVRAAGEINRLMGLHAPVTCLHCKRLIERAEDWYRCTDCGGHYHKDCIAAHARDWRPSHSDGGLERIRAAFQSLRDGKEHASSKLYRVLATEFPNSGDGKHEDHE